MPGSDPKKTDRERQREVAASLGPLVEQEARRFLSEAQLQGDPARIAEDWERRFIADAQRAQEAMELYSELGYEVCADPVRPEEMGEECEDCQLLAALRFKIIYTRKRPSNSELK
jgi:hypothetical protein